MLNSNDKTNREADAVTPLCLKNAVFTDIRNRDTIPFACPANNTAGNADSLIISRVYKSPYFTTLCLLINEMPTTQAILEKLP